MVFCSKPRQGSSAAVQGFLMIILSTASGSPCRSKLRRLKAGYIYMKITCPAMPHEHLDFMVQMNHSIIGDP